MATRRESRIAYTHASRWPGRTAASCSRWRARRRPSRRARRQPRHAGAPKPNTNVTHLPEQLYCPSCRSDCIHHDGVDVFERSEDARYGTRVRVRGVDLPLAQRAPPPRAAEVTVDATLDGNPSSRRQGVTIRFWCEQCSQRSVLTIAQHKGSTLIEHKLEMLHEPKSSSPGQ